MLARIIAVWMALWPLAAQAEYISITPSSGSFSSICAVAVNTQILYDNNGVCGSISGWTTNGSTTITGGASTTLAVGNVAIGSNTFAAGNSQIISGSFGLSGNISGAGIIGTAGIRYKNVAATLTDTTSSGTIATAYTDFFGNNTIAASNATTITDYGTLFVGVPQQGAGVTITNPWSIITGGNVKTPNIAMNGIELLINGANLNGNASFGALRINGSTGGIFDFLAGNAIKGRILYDGANFAMTSQNSSVPLGLGINNSVKWQIDTTTFNLNSQSAAAGITLKQGANGRVGTFVCNGATPVTVSNTSVAVSDAITISLNTVGGTVGAVPAIQTITASTGFTVACTAGDTSTYNYAITKNAAWLLRRDLDPAANDNAPAFLDRAAA